MKTCSKCNLNKPEDEFYLIKGKRIAACKKCVLAQQKTAGPTYKHRSPEFTRNRHIKSKFGISVEEYNKMLISQNYKCAICGTQDSGTKHNNFCIDHCHSSNRIRGLLCTHCNKGIGHFNDNISKLQMAIEYLKTH